MSAFYSAIIMLVVFSMTIMIATVHSDRLLPARSKKGFLMVFFSIGLVSIAEYVSLYSERLGSSYRNLDIISVIIIFTITPSIAIMLASCIIELKNIKIYIAVLCGHFLLQCLSAFYGFIYYVDGSNVYHRGDFYWVYMLLYFSCGVILFHSAYRLSKRYHSKDNYILVVSFLFLLFGTTIQIVYMNIYVVWICVAITAILIFTYYNSLINQMDHQTGMLNRRCFEVQMHRLKRNAVIIFFDIDDFKKINEEYGYDYGDFCLSQIGKIIIMQYSAYGSCYRIGGDEFCVILERKLDLLQLLNLSFTDELVTQKNINPRLPRVSIGYGYYDSTKRDINKAMDEADRRLYTFKRDRK